MLILRLYIAGESPNSQRAVNNLKAICLEYLAGRHQIEIVDILENPLRSFEDGILVTPTLVKLSPPPESKIVGDLGQDSKVLSLLGIQERSH